MIVFQCNRTGLTTRRQLARQAQRRVTAAYVALWALCTLACAAFVWLGAVPFGYEEMTHPAVIACALGASASLASALWFAHEAPSQARDAYLAALFSRGMP